MKYTRDHSGDPAFRQKTLARTVSIWGVGIHTGLPVQLTLRPQPPHAGMRFRRVDSGGVEIPASDARVSYLDLATTVGRDDVTVSTVEHLMAALRMLDVDNVLVDVDGPEVPILDGSSLPFVHLIEAAGLRVQDAPRRIAAVTAPVEARLGDRAIVATPYAGLRVTYRIDFPYPSIGSQTLDLDVDRESFVRELAPARTFAQLADAEEMQRRGLGRGGSHDNCVIFHEGGPLNGSLRFPDEPVRHKALDAVGDLALFGAPLLAHVTVERGGHSLHYALLEALRRHPDRWRWVPELPVSAGLQAPTPGLALGAFHAPVSDR